MSIHGTVHTVYFTICSVMKYVVLCFLNVIIIFMIYHNIESLSAAQQKKIQYTLCTFCTFSEK